MISTIFFIYKVSYCSTYYTLYYVCVMTALCVDMYVCICIRYVQGFGAQIEAHIHW